jgi:magnesium chelatase subunit I
MNEQQVGTLPKTLRDLKDSGDKARPIKEELRDNLIEKLKDGEEVFQGILGYEDTVIPDVQRAILARHNINLLGLRGQAKTSIARAMVKLLDEYIPVVEGGDLNDDPFEPLSLSARRIVEEKGDDTPIAWIHREERYTEKLATPDVTVADLIGDVDPIKAANLGLPYSDERVIHYGLVPNSNRGIFVINELPDLQPRIQVALFNILQEGDIQIRGFKMRLPLDIQFVFTANPEDYTNRGTIVTPLKDRIQSQILTHYPRDIETAKAITKQEARLEKEQTDRVAVPELLEDLAERLAFEARESEYVDHQSGVSARMTITVYENLIGSAERRALLNGEDETTARVADLFNTIAAITGKIELVYEGEQEGPEGVAHHLIGQTIRKLFPTYFPDPESIRRRKDDEEKEDPYRTIVDWFSKNELEIDHHASEEEYRSSLDQVDGLGKLVDHYVPGLSEEERYRFMEFVLHGLAEHSMLSRHGMDRGMSFKDILNSVFSSTDLDDEDDERF